jgi:predicted ArsR family transcriptional regulator
VRDAAHAGGATVGELTETLGGHPNTVRHHLAGLAADGLVETARQNGSAGPGRPATRYRISIAGERALGSASETVEEYVALAGAFADRLADSGGDPGGDARTVGRAWGAALAPRDVRQGASGSGARVVALLERLGFSPTPEPDESGDGSTAVSPGSGTILLRTCPLLDAARRHPEVVCEVHRGLVEGVLVSSGVTADVDLRPFDRPGACVLGFPTAAEGLGA